MAEAPESAVRTARSFDVPYEHRLLTVRDVFSDGVDALLGVLEPSAAGTARCLCVVDSGVADAWPGLDAQIDRVAGMAGAHIEVAGSAVVVEGGEQCKNDPEAVDRMVAAIERSRLCRRSYLVAVGGGALLDLAGFAASIAHRGIRIIRIPTTTMAQGDSGVGVKNGVNRFGKKNFLGAFGVPWAVINDHTFLTTLSDRDWRCGFSEAVKVALVKDAEFFEDIEAAALAIAERDMDIATDIVDRSAVAHLDHIALGGDPFERTTARPLDFGHWSAHKLEQRTDFTIRHGEAVAIGIMIDATYAHLVGLLDRTCLERIRSVLERMGFTLQHDELRNAPALFAGIEEFREHLGGELTIAMLRGIGQGVDVHEIDEGRMLEAIRSLC